MATLDGTDKVEETGHAMENNAWNASIFQTKVLCSRHFPTTGGVRGFFVGMKSLRCGGYYYLE
jgi:hypothetical protein